MHMNHSVKFHWWHHLRKNRGSLPLLIRYKCFTTMSILKKCYLLMPTTEPWLVFLCVCSLQSNCCTTGATINIHIQGKISWISCKVWVAGTHTVELSPDRFALSLSSNSDDNMLKNIELFDKLSLRFNGRVLFIKDVIGDEICCWSFYGQGRKIAEVCCTSIVYATEKKQTKVKGDQSIHIKNQIFYPVSLGLLLV